MQGQWATINIRDVSTGGSNSNALQLQHTADGTNWVGVMNLTLSNVQGARMFQIGAEGEYRVGSDATTTNTAVVHFIVGGHSPFDY